MNDGPIARVLSRPIVLPGLLTALWLASVAAVDPVGDFPLNDDWSYAHVVRTLIDEGKLEYTGWTSMPLITQVLWGVLFSLPCGFSFTALRISTLVLGLVGVLATYGILRELGARRRVAFLGAVVVAGNPLYLGLSHTFMSDVPFFAFTVTATLFLIRAIARDSGASLVLGCVLMVLATLIRQTGLALPLAVGVSFAATFGWSRRNAWIATAPFLAAFAALTAFETGVDRTIGLPALYHEHTRKLVAHLGTGAIPVLSEGLSVTRDALVYLGLFLLPLSLVSIGPLARELPRRRRAWLLAMVAVASAVLAVPLLIQQRIMPLAGNVLHSAGLGPFLLRDAAILGSNVPEGSRTFWLVLTVLGAAGGALLVATVALAGLRRGRGGDSGRQPARWAYRFSLLASAAFALPFVASAHLFDRYLIVLLPFPMIAVLAGTGGTGTGGGRGVHSVGLALALAAACLSTAATHDYLAWNRARWAAVRDLLAEGDASIREIDGGFEVNAHYLHGLQRSRGGKSWWWVHDDRYVVSLGPIEGYRTLRTWASDPWLPGGIRAIHVQERIPGSRRPGSERALEKDAARAGPRP